MYISIKGTLLVPNSLLNYMEVAFLLLCLKARHNNC